MILQLNPALPFETPKGKGWAHFIIDYSQEHDIYYVVFLNDSGECWTFPNSQIRLSANHTFGRTNVSSIASSSYNWDSDW